MAGALGTGIRYVLSVAALRTIGGAFPAGTFVANVLGCGVFGFVTALAARGGALTDDTRVILTTGFCGGLTTYSSFNNEISGMVQQGRLALLGAYGGLTVISGLLCAALGASLAARAAP
jgi:CrcB protein